MTQFVTARGRTAERMHEEETKMTPAALSAPDATRPGATRPWADASPPQPAEATDVDLVAAIARGRNDALSELYRRYSNLLLALAVRILHNADDAEEVTQEVFLYVWKKACRYDAVRASVSSWLVLITRSRSLDRLRKLQRFDHLVEEYQHEDSPPRQPEGFGQVLSGERATRVRRALGRLPPPQRKAVELAFYHGWTQKEVAERTGVPLGTIKTRTFLAMKKLRRELTCELRLLM
jgi:RNA polymerase sigma-70 factor (ECF subfamily)